MLFYNSQHRQKDAFGVTTLYKWEAETQRKWERVVYEHFDINNTAKKQREKGKGAMLRGFKICNVMFLIIWPILFITESVWNKKKQK